jgi:hypothetical protein
MNNKKIKNLTLGIFLVIVGVLFAVSYAFQSVATYFIGVGLSVLGLSILIPEIVVKRKVLTAHTAIGAALTLISILFYIEPFSKTVFDGVIYIFTFALIGIAGLLLIDAIVCFITRKKNTAAKVAEIIISLLLLFFGIYPLCVKDGTQFVCLFVGIPAILAGLIIIIASAINFQKYKELINKK